MKDLRALSEGTMLAAMRKSDNNNQAKQVRWQEKELKRTVLIAKKFFCLDCFNEKHYSMQ